MQKSFFFIFSLLLLKEKKFHEKIKKKQVLFNFQ